MKTLVLAHYYTTPKVQQLADFVGDSLDLSLRAKESDAERIVFAGVKFMAETAKIINPDAEVILPDALSTCSLVTESTTRNFIGARNLEDILRDKLSNNVHQTIVTYINSSYQVKALSDVIVTSANVENIVTDLINAGKYVYFTPDRNMGAYLAFSNPEWGSKFDYYTNATCVVHEQFKIEEINKVMSGWANFGKVLLAHPESPLPVLQRANIVGSTKKMLNYVKATSRQAIIYVATEEGLLHNMREARPDLDIRLAPTYSGCQCNACPYMKKNTVEAVQAAIDGYTGLGTNQLVIDYIPEDIRKRAKLPINIMLNWGDQK